MGEKLEQGRISSSQLVYLFIAVTLSTVTILGLAAKNGPNAWLVGVVGIIEGGIFVWLFSALSARFVDKTFVEICDLVFGKYLGKVVSGLFLWFLLHIGSLTIFDSSEFIVATVFEETPIWIIRVGFMLVSMYAVRHGIEVIARCANILVPLFIVDTIVTLGLSLPNIQMRNFLPLWDISLKELLHDAHILAVLPLAESVVLLMVTPFMTENRRAPTIFLKALLIVSVISMMITVRNIGVLGNTAPISLYPSFESVELISIGKILTRIEVLISTSLMSQGFLTITTFYYSVVLGAAQLFGLRSYQPLVTPIGILMVLMSGLHVSTMPEANEFIDYISPFYHLFFEVGLPLLTLIVAKIRGLPKK